MVQSNATATLGSETAPPPAQSVTAPGLPVAWVFDGTAEDGRPLVRRQPLDPAEMPPVSHYLRNAPMVMAPGPPEIDQLDPRRGNVVPATWHTDGDWIWSGSVDYYLQVHGLPPQPELLTHMRRRGFTMPIVTAERRRVALAVIGGAPIPTPRPTTDNAPAAAGPAEPGKSAEPGVAPPEVPNPEAVAVPEIAVPEVAAPEVAKPEIAPPDIAEPEVGAEPEVVAEPQPVETADDAEPVENAAAEPQKVQAGTDSPELRQTLQRATDAVTALGIDPERVCIDGERDGAWCLCRDGARWLVFTKRSDRRKGTEFDTVHEAVDYFVGHLYLRQDEYQPIESKAVPA